MVTFANTNSLCDFYKNIITIVHYGNNIFDSSLYITLQIKVVSERISILNYIQANSENLCMETNIAEPGVKKKNSARPLPSSWDQGIGCPDSFMDW